MSAQLFTDMFFACNTSPLPIIQDLPYWLMSCTHLQDHCWICQPPQTDIPTNPGSSCRLLLIPPDLQLSIFRHLDTLTDVTRLAATCRSFRSLLQSCPTSILRPVAERSITAFGDALRTARASLLATDHFNVTPPTAEFCISLASAPVTLPELAVVCKLAGIVRNWESLLEQTHLFTRCAEHLWFDDYPGSVERFHRASYRYLLMGYLFAGQYAQILSEVVENQNDTPSKEEQLGRLSAGFMDWIITDGAERGNEESLCSFDIIELEDDENNTPPGAPIKTFDGATQGAIHESMLLMTLVKLGPVLLGIVPAWFGCRNYFIMPIPQNNYPSIEIRLLSEQPQTVFIPYLNCVPASHPTNNTPVLLPTTVAHPGLEFVQAALKRHFGLRIRERWSEEGTRPGAWVHAAAFIRWAGHTEEEAGMEEVNGEFSWALMPPVELV